MILPGSRTSGAVWDQRSQRDGRVRWPRASSPPTEEPGKRRNMWEKHGEMLGKMKKVEKDTEKCKKIWRNAGKHAGHRKYDRNMMRW